MERYCPCTLEETEAAAIAFVKNKQRPLLLSFFGPMGAGKTSFIKALAAFYGIPKERVTSPTFQYLHIYTECGFPFVHFDLYRLSHASQFIDMGFEDFFHCPGIVCIEWAERIASLLPPSATKIILSHQETGRLIEVI